MPRCNPTSGGQPNERPQWSRQRWSGFWRRYLSGWLPQAGAQNRFRPGQSGNPKGRPKDALGVRAYAALDETVHVAENGKARSIRKRQAILLAMIAKAIKGDVRAAVLVTRLMEAHDPAPRLPDGHLSHEDWLDLLGGTDAASSISAGGR